MAATTDSSGVTEKFGKLEINVEDDVCKNGGELQEITDLEYGLPLHDVYKLALGFYKEKEGKAVHFSYEDRLQLVAFSQQVNHGPLTDALAKLPPLGALDVVGRDRRLAWQKLGKLSADQARAGFVELLSRKCPLFSAYIEAHRREKKEQERLQREEDKRKQIEEEEMQKKREEERRQQEQADREELIKRQIQQALNEQTYEQFRKYAEQQFPGEPEKQGALVKQLQEQHYIQYMQQLQAAQQSHAQQPKEILDNSSTPVAETEHVDSNENITNDEEETDDVLPASMWTRSDIEAFKQAISQAEGDGVIRIGHGETVTVRVPTHHEGSRLFWEFATDHYDIGFGVYFEFGTPTSSQVSVHVCETDEEDDADIDEDGYDEEAIHTGDLESGSISTNGVTKPLLIQIIPVFRRDCQTEVYAGSHEYPGQGVYLLKFDNSYSLWRSKTLYYRVYYSQ